MTRIFYAIVDGDPLTSGGYVVVPPHGDTVQDDEGRKRHLAYVGHNAWCAQCKTMGVIIGGSGISDDMRLFDQTLGGLKQAVSGDYVACGCREHPRVVARYATCWTLADSEPVASALPRRTAQQDAQWDEQFVLLDATGRALADTYYTIRYPSGDLVHGVTDIQGRTSRHETKGAAKLSLFIGHLHG
jgi:hypothetical protein